MRFLRRPLVLPAAIAVAAISLIGCSDDGTPEAREGDGATTTTTTTTTTAAAPSTSGTAEGQGGATAAVGTCERLDETPDGVYRLESGQVTMEREGDTLVLGGVEPAEGWVHRVDDQDPDEIEIDFRRDARELDFEAEIDDGVLTIEVCIDQDD